MLRSAVLPRLLALLLVLATVGSAAAVPCSNGAGGLQLFGGCAAADTCCEEPCGAAGAGACEDEEHERAGCLDCACCALRAPAAIGNLTVMPPTPVDELLRPHPSAPLLERASQGVFRPPRPRS